VQKDSVLPPFCRLCLSCFFFQKAGLVPPASSSLGPCSGTGSYPSLVNRLRLGAIFYSSLRSVFTGSLSQELDFLWEFLLAETRGVDRYCDDFFN